MQNLSAPENSAPPNSITSPQLQSMSDDAIKQLISEGYKLLDQRKREREKKVKDQIKQLASEAGIKVSFREQRQETRGRKKEFPE